MVHRIKSNLRNNLKIWKDDLNVICISGGSNSMALLSMMKQALFGPSQKKMFFKVHVLHIDERHNGSRISTEDKDENLHLIVEAAKKCGFTYSVLPLELVFSLNSISFPGIAEKEEEKKEEDESSYINKVFSASPEDAEKLKELLEVPSPLCSNKEDLILFLKKWLMLWFAERFGFKKLLLGTTGFGVAAKTLSEISKGRGASFPH